jgi:Fibronectin type III domain
MKRITQFSGSLGVLFIGAWLAACHDNSTADTQTAMPDASSARSLTLSWDAPTQNIDGSPLVGLGGYRIYYGATPQVTNVVDVNNPGLNTYVLDNLTAGTYYFAVAAYNSAGVESSLSAVVSATID